MRCRISKRFTTHVEPTPRVVAVAHAYGLGIDETQRFPLFDNFEVEIEPSDIIYITGETGSGKSTLLRELAAQLAGDAGFAPVANSADIHVPPDERVIEGVGASAEEAMRILAGAGLAEAFRLAQLPARYLLWRNPAYPQYPEPV